MNSIRKKTFSTFSQITRTKNKWRFTLKSGVMSIEGRDYVFSKATGEADW